MKICYRHPALNHWPGWYVRVWGKWYRIWATNPPMPRDPDA